MGSKGRALPPHLRRPLPGPGMGQPDPFGPGIRPPLPGAFPLFDMLPPPEVMEQKLAAQHGEMQRLAAENQRLAATHGTLRHELAAAQHELQLLQGQIGAVKSEREQQMRGLMDNITKMETELQGADSLKLELQKARGDAQGLVAVRQELITKVQQLSQDLKRAHSDVQQIPALLSELECLRQEYQQCRASYEYEKKLYNDHLESLQVMEKNYITMAREVEKLRAELTNSANVERRPGGPYGVYAGYNENEASGHYPVGHNSFEDGYGGSQGYGHAPGGNASGGGGGSSGPTTNARVQPSPAPARVGYDVPRVTGYDALPGYNPEGGQRAPSHYDASRGVGYDAQHRGGPGPYGQVPPPNNVPYGSATPPARGGSAYDAPPRGGNPRR